MVVLLISFNKVEVEMYQDNILSLYICPLNLGVTYKYSNDTEMKSICLLS